VHGHGNALDAAREFSEIQVEFVAAQWIREADIQFGCIELSNQLLQNKKMHAVLLNISVCIAIGNEEKSLLP
jgi:hypothetical protein